MQPARFPPGEVLMTGRPFNESLFAEVDRLLAQGSCPDGRLELQTKETRITCLVHQSVPHLAGLQEGDFFSWVPLKDFPVRVRQLESPVCSLVRSDPIRVLLVAVHFRNRPEMQASTELVDISHVLKVLEKEGQDAALSLDREGARTLLFIQKGKPSRLYFGNPSDDPEEGTIEERLLLFAFNPRAGPGKVEVFKNLNIEPDPDAGISFQRLAEAAKPPPPTSIKVHLGGRVVLQRPFMPPSMTIGRDHICELLLDNLSVSREHARLSWDKGRFVIEDLKSANGTLVAGKPVKRSTLSFTDRVTIGKFELSLGEATESHHPDATMIMSSGDDDKSPGYLVGGNQSVPMGQEITIGKADNADVRARGLWVRPLHLRIRPEGERSFRLVCISGRGVKVNGERVESTSLRFGDKIEVGRSSFRLVPVLGDEPTNA